MERLQEEEGDSSSGDVRVKRKDTPCQSSWMLSPWVIVAVRAKRGDNDDDDEGEGDGDGEGDGEEEEEEEDDGSERAVRANTGGKIPMYPEFHI